MPGCTEPCADRASIVLTASDDLVSGELPNDLRVDVHGDGRVAVLRGTTVIGTGSTDATVTSVQIRVTPGTNAADRAVLLATVTVAGTVIVTDAEFLRQSRVLTDPTVCRDGPGLYVAVEGIGDPVRIRSISFDTNRCANPSHFTRVSSPAVIRATATRTDASDLVLPWATGGIGMPALASFSPTGADTAFHLLVDGTNTPRVNESFLHVGMAIGGGISSDGVIDWMSRGMDGAETVIGPMAPPHPTAVDPDLSAREPSLLALVNDMGLLGGGGQLLGAYAAETSMAAPRDIYAIQGIRLGLDPDDPATDSFRVEPFGPCHSLRDPLLLPRAPDGSTGYWLFFTCMPESLATDKPMIMAVQINGTLTSTVGEPEEMITPAIDGNASANGVYGAEGVARFVGDPTDTVLYRLWYVEVDADGVTRIAMAQSEFAPGTDQVPVFTRYPGNPVLESNAVALGGCSENCYLEGLAATIVGGQGVVADVPGRGATVRLLVARSVNDEMTGARYELVPLEQFWR
jgi:hypothetical protein